MKQFLVDVPVKINIWIRRECQKEQWNIIKRVRPSILFIQSDGGRNQEERNLILENRKMIDESIDWDCTVYRFYEDTNQGLYAMINKVNRFVWEKVDRCIFLEDDDIPSLSFFVFCSELLERYKDDQRIECICGFNHLNNYETCKDDYFFSRQGSIWGIATWKRAYLERNYFEYYNNDYVMALLKEQTKYNKIAWRRLNAYGQNKLFENHIPGGEFWIEFNMYSQNRLQIIPTKNLIKNIGFGKDSLHSSEFKKMPKSMRALFDSKTYELDFPLKHPNYVIPDSFYEKKRNKIMHYNENFIIVFLKRCFKAIKYLFTDPSYLAKRFKKKETEK